MYYRTINTFSFVEVFLLLTSNALAYIIYIRNRKLSLDSYAHMVNEISS